MDEPYLYGRKTYEKIREFVESMYDEHSTYPESYAFRNFEEETYRVIYEMSVDDDGLKGCLLYIALAISAIRREKSIPKVVKTNIERVLTDDIIKKYNDELLNIEKEQIVNDLNYIAEYMKNIPDN